jgi:hypothetical protein
VQAPPSTGLRDSYTIGRWGPCRGWARLIFTDVELRRAHHQRPQRRCTPRRAGSASGGRPYAMERFWSRSRASLGALRAANSLSAVPDIKVTLFRRMGLCIPRLPHLPSNCATASFCGGRTHHASPLASFVVNAAHRRSLSMPAGPGAWHDGRQRVYSRPHFPHNCAVVGPGVVINNTTRRLSYLLIQLN